MKYILDQLYLDISSDPRELKPLISRRLAIPEKNFRYEIIDREYHQDGLKRGICYKVSIETIDFIRDTSIHFLPEINSFDIPEYPHKDRPVVIGAGFAGLFAAYVLALSGAKPIVIEQGKDIAKRKADYEGFKTQGRMEGLTDGRFGVGGYLGTTGFRLSKESDSLQERWIFDSIETLGMPLPKSHHVFFSSADSMNLASAMVSAILRSGGEIYTESVATGIKSMLGKVREVRFSEKGKERNIPTGHVIVACGENNASMLRQGGVDIGSGGLSCFSFLLEKPLSELNRPIYGSASPDPRLPLSFMVSGFNPDPELHVTLTHFYPNAYAVPMGTTANLVDVGVALGKSNEPNGISVLNIFKNEGNFSVGEEGVLIGRARREMMPYAAPAETVKDYLSGKDPIRLGAFKPSYSKGVYLANLERVYPGKVGEALKTTLERLVRKEACFADGRALLFGPTLTYDNGSSSPLADSGKTNMKGLYFSAPKRNYDYSLRLVADAGITAALALLKGK